MAKAGGKKKVSKKKRPKQTWKHERMPALVPIDRLLTRKQFDEPLLHMTSAQWKRSLEISKPRVATVKKPLPPDAVQFAAWELPGGNGVVVNPFFRCPPGCTPIGGRGLVCDELSPVGFTPRPECFFEPQCICDPVIPDVGGPAPSQDCDHSNCRSGFAPMQFEIGLALLFACSPKNRKCKKCTFGIEQQWNGTYYLGCLCTDC